MRMGRNALLLALGVLLPLGCSFDDRGESMDGLDGAPGGGTEEADDGGDDGGGDEETGGGGDDGGDDGDGTADDGGDDGDGTGDDGGATGDDGGATGDDGGTTGGGDGLPDGSSCTDASECASGNCYILPMAGVCAECDEDADCQGADGVGTCEIDLDAQQAFCTEGELGASCEEDSSCAGDLICAEVIDAGGLINGDACSTCRSDADCGGGDLCAPVLFEGTLGGYLDCAAPGSVQNDQGCPLDQNDEGVDAACASGHCSVANVAGLDFVKVGVCGECETNSDCGAGICSGPNATLTGVTGARCL
jgi:hypothetical protein